MEILILNELIILLLCGGQVEIVLKLILLLIIILVILLFTLYSKAVDFFLKKNNKVTIYTEPNKVE